MTNIVAYTAENDPNKLLGRPNQYTAKVNWNDGRAPNKSEPDATIEVYLDETSMKARAEYVAAVTKGIPMLTQYIYTNARTRSVLRLPHALTPDQAKAYEEWLTKLGA